MNITPASENYWRVNLLTWLKYIQLYFHRCQCLAEFDGPRCQQTKHSFRGDGWAWYKALAQCESSHTSLEFITTRDNGLILYHGPVGDAAVGGTESQDFLLLELRNGYPFLRMNFGAGETKLTVDGRDKFGHVRLPRLNDGHWHRVDMIRSGKVVRHSFVLFLSLYRVSHSWPLCSTNG